MTDTVKLYPANWLYNASVIGFLKVIDEIAPDSWDSSSIRFDSGTVEIRKQLLAESIAYYKKYNDGKIPLVGKNRYFPNYLQSSDVKNFETFVGTLGRIEEHGDSQCGFCFGNFSFGKSEKFSAGVKKLLDRVASDFSVVHSSTLGPSVQLPNAYWNLNSSIKICPLCAYLIVFSQIPFLKTRNGEIFINAGSFEMMWKLNQYSEKVFGDTSAKEIYATSLIDFSQKIKRTLGMWTLFNIEMVIKTYDSIDYFSLPGETSRLLLNRNISYLIAKTKEPLVLNTILDGKYDRLMKLCNSVMRAVASGSVNNDENLVSQLKDKTMRQMKNLADVLPELYIRINRTLDQEAS